MDVTVRRENFISTNLAWRSNNMQIPLSVVVNFSKTLAVRIDIRTARFLEKFIRYGWKSEEFFAIADYGWSSFEQFHKRASNCELQRPFVAHNQRARFNSVQEYSSRHLQTDLLSLSPFNAARYLRYHWAETYHSLSKTHFTCHYVNSSFINFGLRHYQSTKWLLTIPHFTYPLQLCTYVFFL